MQPLSSSISTFGDDLAVHLREVRAAYDRLDRGAVAQIRRCKHASELELEAIYWRLAAAFQAHYPALVRRLANVVLLFPYARHRDRKYFSMGRFLSRSLGERAGAELRFRRVLAAEDADDLAHRLRGLLRLSEATSNPVDWGVLGRDMLWFFAESDATRRRWAQDFYAPLPHTPDDELSVDLPIA
jgi:CRISPR type I-E-associated protein CasB/Cse2